MTWWPRYFAGRKGRGGAFCTLPNYVPPPPLFGRANPHTHARTHHHIHINEYTYVCTHSTWRMWRGGYGIASAGNTGTPPLQLRRGQQRASEASRGARRPQPRLLQTPPQGALPLFFHFHPEDGGFSLLLCPSVCQLSHTASLAFEHSVCVRLGLARRQQKYVKGKPGAIVEAADSGWVVG